MNFIFIIISFFHHLFMDFIAAPFHLLPSLAFAFAFALSPDSCFLLYLSLLSSKKERRGRDKNTTCTRGDDDDWKVEKRKRIKLSFNFTQSFFMCANNNIALLDNFMSFWRGRKFCDNEQVQWVCHQMLFEEGKKRGT
jgi:hypothetical protein